MTTYSDSKLNYLLNSWPSGSVITKGKLSDLGYSDDLVSWYLKSNWIIPLGYGAYSKPGSTTTWVGGVNALQEQSKLKVHVGAVSALILKGRAQYGLFGKFPLHLFGESKTKLPKWFSNYKWNAALTFSTPNIFKTDDDLGLSTYEENGVRIKISSHERALFEVIYFVPQKYTFTYAEELFEFGTSLRPSLVNELLHQCKSIKVKRIFLYLAEKLDFSWFKELDVANLDLGKGKRVIEKNGRLDKKYLITVPVGYEEKYDESIF